MVKIVYAFFYAISLLPFRLLYCIADFEYFMMYRVIKYRRGCLFIHISEPTRPY